MSDSAFRPLARCTAAIALFAALGLTAAGVCAQTTATKKAGTAATSKSASKKARQAPKSASSPHGHKSASPAPGRSTTSSAPSAAAQAVTSPSGAHPRQADYIVALVNGEPITHNELRARMARARQQLRERNLSEPSEEALRKQVLEVFISERAQLQMAQEMGIQVDQLTLDQAELSVAQQNDLPSVQALHEALQREGIAVKDFQDDLRRQIQLQRLRERAIESRVTVTDAEVDRFIREQMAQQGIQAVPEVNLAMILVRVPEGSSATEVAQLRERAETVARRAQAGEDFAKLAAEYSQSTGGGKDGGELGLRPVDRYPSLFINATSRLPVGGITDVVRSDAGFHVLKVLERKRGALPTMTVPQTHARHILLTLSASQDEQSALQRLRDFKRRVESGQADFADLAREYSQDGSAREGGDLGWANPGQFVPEFEQVMNGLAPGQISEPLRSRFGLHLIQVLERREQPLTEADQRAIARNMLRERKMAEEYETWAKEVRGRAYVELRDAPY